MISNIFLRERLQFTARFAFQLAVVLCLFLNASFAKELSQNQISTIQERLATEQDVDTRIRLHILLINNAIQYLDPSEELKYRKEMVADLKGKEPVREQYLANLYQLATLYYKTGSSDESLSAFEDLLKIIPLADTKLRNLTLQHLSVIGEKLNKPGIEEKYLALYVIALSKVSPFYETTGGYEKLMALAAKTRSKKEHYYFENWYQAAQKNGEKKDQKRVLTQWVNFATQPGSFSDKPFELLIEFLQDQNALAELKDLRLLYAQTTPDETRQTHLYEDIYQYNSSHDIKTDLGILTRLYKSYKSSGNAKKEQEMLEILSTRDDYQGKQEALRQLAILSQKNEDWVLSLNTFQKLYRFTPLDKNEQGIVILNNLISVSQKLSKDDLTLRYLKEKALAESPFVDDKAKYDAFVLALDIYRQKQAYDEALEFYKDMRDTTFKEQPYPKLYEIHFQGALLAEEKGDYKECASLYQLSLDTLLKNGTPDLDQAVRIAQKLLLITESYFPGKKEIAILERIRGLQQQQHNIRDQAKTELLIAQKMEKLGENKDAVVYYNHALDSYRQLKDQNMVNQLLTLLTNLEEGTSGEKLKRLQELESSQESSGDLTALVITRMEMGNYHKTQGDTDAAIQYYLKAADTLKSNQTIESAQAAYYAAILISQKGDIDRSNQELQKVLGLQQLKEKNPALFAEIHQAYAKNLDQQGNTAAALEQVEMALSLNVAKLSDSLVETKATIQINGNQLEAARQTANNHLKRVKEPKKQIPFLILIAKADIGLQQYGEAISALQKAAEIHGNAVFSSQLYDILSLKSTALSLQKNMVEAIANQEKLITNIEQSSQKALLGPANLDLAKYYLEIGRIPEAFRANKQAEPWVAEKSNEQLLLLMNYAKAYQKQGKNKESLNYFNQIHDLITPASPKEIVAEMYYQRGFTYLNTSRFEDALKDFQQSEKSYKALGRPQEVTQSKMAQANVLISLGKISNAEKIYLSLLEKVKTDSGAQGDVNNALAFLYSEMGLYQKALNYSEAAEKSYNRANQKSRTPEVLNARGLIFLKMNDFDQAEITFVSAAKANAEFNNPLLESEITNNLGGLYKEEGDLEKAREQLMKTAELQKKLGFDSLLALTYNNIGSVYLEENKYEEALSFLQQSRTFAQRFNLKKELASSWNNQGILFFKQEKYDEAEKAFNEAIKPQKELELNIDLARTHNNLSIIAAKREDFKKALDLVQFAVKSLSLKPLPEKGFYPNPDQNSVLAPVLMKDSLRIKGSYLKELANRSQQEQEKIRYLDASYQSYALAIDIIESLRAQMKGEESQKKLMQTNIDIFQQLIAILYELGEKMPGKGYQEKAFYYTEMSRARSFLDQLQEQVARSSSNLPKDVRDRENNLKDQIADLDGKIFVELSKPQKERDKSKIEQWQIQKTAKLLEYRDFTRELEERFPAYASLKYPKVYGVKEVRDELLDDKTVALAYFLGEDKSYGWVIGKNLFRMVALAPNSDIDQLIRKYRTTLVDPLIRPDEEDDELVIDSTQSHVAIGLQIYRSIVHPLLDGTGENIKHLIIIPDGVLYYLPFETVLTQIHPQTDKRFPLGREYMIHRYSINYSPSISVLGMIYTQVKHRDPKLMAERKDFLGFGDPEYKPDDKDAATFHYNPTLKRQGFYDLSRLFNSRIELKKIAAFFKGSETIFMRDKATESAVKSHMMGYRYIHFATHGILDERNPEFSGVVMDLVQPDKPEDGFLQSSEIFDLHIDSDMVVLSACETGLGKVIKGEGMVGLTRSFLFAGTPSIVVSLWTVADESTSKLMIYFYEKLKEGYEKDEALRQARLKLMNEIVDDQYYYSDPFFWGPFILNGARL